MNAPFASRTQVRLRADEEVFNQISVLNDEAYRRFFAVWRFAEDVLPTILSVQTRRPSFFVELDGMSLLIEFCRTREIFMIVSFVDFRDDPEPPRPGRTVRPTANVEDLLGALGIDSTLHKAKRNLSDSSDVQTNISLSRSAILDHASSTPINENRLTVNRVVKDVLYPLFADNRPIPVLSKLRAFAIRRPAWGASFSPLIVSEDKGMITFTLRPPPR